LNSSYRRLHIGFDSQQLLYVSDRVTQITVDIRPRLIIGVASTSPNQTDEVKGRPDRDEELPDPGNLEKGIVGHLVGRLWKQRRERFGRRTSEIENVPSEHDCSRPQKDR
jgi:hypothetical protein